MNILPRVLNMQPICFLLECPNIFGQFAVTCQAKSNIKVFLICRGGVGHILMAFEVRTQRQKTSPFFTYILFNKTVPQIFCRNATKYSQMDSLTMTACIFGQSKCPLLLSFKTRSLDVNCFPLKTSVLVPSQQGIDFS